MRTYVKPALVSLGLFLGMGSEGSPASACQGTTGHLSHASHITSDVDGIRGQTDEELVV